MILQMSFRFTRHRHHLSEVYALFLIRSADLVNAPPRYCGLLGWGVGVGVGGGLATAVNEPCQCICVLQGGTSPFESEF